MDKRYLLIIIIIAVSFINLYIIYDASDVVGSASVNLNEFTFSLPPNFDLLYSNNEYIEMYSSDLGNVYISYEDASSENDYQHRLDYIENRSDMILLSTGNIDVGNITVYSIFYQKDNSTGTLNQSSFIFERYDKRFTIGMTNFDYDKRDKTIEIAVFLIESLRPNYEMG